MPRKKRRPREIAFTHDGCLYSVPPENLGSVVDRLSALFREAQDEIPCARQREREACDARRARFVEVADWLKVVLTHWADRG